MQESIAKEKIKEDLEKWLIENKINYAKFVKRSIDFIIEEANRYIIKVLSDASSLTNYSAIDLRNVACFLHALPFIIAPKYKSLRINDGKVYINKSIYITNPRTFKKMVSNEKVTVVKKGKNTTYIDNYKIKELRRKEGLSLQQFANKLGISKKTAYLLERKNSASTEIIERIKKTFNEDITAPLPFNTRPIIIKGNLNIKPKEKPYTYTYSFPYDILAFSHQISYAVIDNEKKADEAIKLHQMIKNKSIFILMTDKRNIKNKIKRNLIQGQLLHHLSN